MAAIFLVEDEVLIRMLVADMATELGHTIAAETGDLKHGLELAAEKNFDVAILDLQLLDGSSEPLAKVLARRKIPFAFASGYGPDGLPEQFKDRPVLRKPFEIQELQTCIAALLSIRELTSGLPTDFAKASSAKRMSGGVRRTSCANKGTSSLRGRIHPS
jgi:CheY-like chemotaxis protein